MNRQKPPIIQQVGLDFSWDERKVWAIDVPTEEMAIDELAWHLDVPFLWKKPDGYYDLLPRDVIENPLRYSDEYERTIKADTSYPIDIVWWRGRWVILDVLHRLMKLTINEVASVKVRKISTNNIAIIKT